MSGDTETPSLAEALVSGPRVCDCEGATRADEDGCCVSCGLDHRAFETPMSGDTSTDEVEQGRRDLARGVELGKQQLKRSLADRHYQDMETTGFERAIFSEYAFVGWVWTITHHHREITGSTCPPEFQWLGDAGVRSWAMDAAMRKGWAMLGDDARAFATESLLPLCEPWLRDMLLGTLRSRGATP